MVMNAGKGGDLSFLQKSLWRFSGSYFGLGEIADFREGGETPLILPRQWHT